MSALKSPGESVIFYRKDELIDRIASWLNEDKWRYGRFKGIIEFAERYFAKDLGSGQMTFYKTLKEENNDF